MKTQFGKWHFIMELRDRSNSDSALRMEPHTGPSLLGAAAKVMRLLVFKATVELGRRM